MNWVDDLIYEPNGSCPGLVISLHADHEFGMLLDRRNHGHRHPHPAVFVR